MLRHLSRYRIPIGEVFHFARAKHVCGDWLTFPGKHNLKKRLQCSTYTCTCTLVHLPCSIDMCYIVCWISGRLMIISAADWNEESLRRYDVWEVGVVMWMWGVEVMVWRWLCDVRSGGGDVNVRGGGDGVKVIVWHEEWRWWCGCEGGGDSVEVMMWRVNTSSVWCGIMRWYWFEGLNFSYMYMCMYTVWVECLQGVWGRALQGNLVNMFNSSLSGDIWMRYTFILLELFLIVYLTLLFFYEESGAKLDWGEGNSRTACYISLCRPPISIWYNPIQSTISLTTHAFYMCPHLLCVCICICTCTYMYKNMYKDASDINVWWFVSEGLGWLWGGGGKRGGHCWHGERQNISKSGPTSAARMSRFLLSPSPPLRWCGLAHTHS